MVLLLPPGFPGQSPLLNASDMDAHYPARSPMDESWLYPLGDAWLHGRGL